MKSEHRHELKTNELAEWITHFPQWARENRIIIIGVLLVIVVTGIVYIWNIYRKNIIAQQETELTTYMSQILGSKMQIMKAQSQGKDFSYILLQPANSLKSFAQTINNDRMDAFALIKRGLALRTELHYRLVPANQQDMVTQINIAKESYNEAIKKAASFPSLLAEAKFGLGLCEEELGNFQAAQQAYQDITTNPDFEGTVAIVAAKRRLETMAEFKTSVIFTSSIKPKLPEAEQPKIEIKPVDINTLPLEIRKKFQDANMIGKAPVIIPKPETPANESASVDGNQPNK
jgi:tetratricopeptide (TPR) repeat protein